MLILSTIVDSATVKDASESWLPTAIIAAFVAGFTSIVVARLNHKNEARKWQREARREVYGEFLKKCHDFINESSRPYSESTTTPDERYRQFLELKNFDIPLIGTMKVVQAQSLAIYEIGKYWELVRDTGLIREEDQSKATTVTQCLKLVQFEMRKELSVGVSLVEWWDSHETMIRNQLKAVMRSLSRIWEKLFVSPVNSVSNNLTIRKIRRRHARELRRNHQRRKSISKMRRRAVKRRSASDSR